MIRDNALLTPLYEVVRTIQPEAAATAVASKVALEVFWSTLTNAGTANAGFVLVTLIDRFPAACDSKTLQLAAEPTAIRVGVQARDKSVGVGQSEIVVLCEEPSKTAVTTAWPFAETVPAVALTLPVELPAGTIRTPGTDSSPEFEFSETVALEETGRDSVTEQVAAPPDISPPGLQTMLETTTDARRLTVKICELPPSVALTVAPWLLGIMAPALTLKVAAVVPAATITVEGTASRLLSLARLRVEPPGGAAWLIIAVHVDVPPPLKLAGLHATEETAGTMTTPPAAAGESPVPVASTPTGLTTLIHVVPAFGIRVTWTFAMTPVPMPLVFKPLARHLNEPAREPQASAFPAAADAAPAVALIAETCVVG
jgi:hypothetical protein